jgi:hypothetical protein
VYNYTKGLFRRKFYGYYYECEGRAEKALTKLLPGTFPTLSKWLAGVYNCTEGLFRRKCSLNDCIVVYLSDIK